MHCIGASLCFWIYTIKNETLDSYITKYFSDMKMPFAEDECEDNEDDLRYTFTLEAQIILSGMKQTLLQTYTCLENLLKIVVA